MLDCGMHMGYNDEVLFLLIVCFNKSVLPAAIHYVQLPFSKMHYNTFKTQSRIKVQISLRECINKRI